LRDSLLASPLGSHRESKPPSSSEDEVENTNLTKGEFPGVVRLEEGRNRSNSLSTTTKKIKYEKKNFSKRKSCVLHPRKIGS